MPACGGLCTSIQEDFDTKDESARRGKTYYAKGKKIKLLFFYLVSICTTNELSMSHPLLQPNQHPLLQSHHVGRNGTEQNPLMLSSLPSCRNFQDKRERRDSGKRMHKVRQKRDENPRMRSTKAGSISESLDCILELAVEVKDSSMALLNEISQQSPTQLHLSQPQPDYH